MSATKAEPISPIKAEPISAVAFAPFGDLIEPDTVAPTLINAGLCDRFTDLALLEARDGRLGVSLFRATLRDLPLRVELMERHPEGSQAFIPLDGGAYLVVVAEDDNGRPGPVRAFLAGPQQPVNIARNTWHGVLAPIEGPGLFVVLDRIGPGRNLEEHRLAATVWVTLPREA
jgi:ureidoglycolate lyase